MARQAFLLAKTPILVKWKEILEEHPESCHFEFPGSTHAMRMRYEREELVLEYEDRDVPYLSGAVGMSVFNGSHCAYRGLEVRHV